jgi:hypothetical protein
LKQQGHTIAATSGVLLIIPCPTDITTLLKDDKVAAVVPLDEVYRHVHALTRDL